MKIRCSLSGKSFRQAAKEVKKYRARLDKKVSEFVAKVAEAGYDVIEAVLEAHEFTGETLGSLDIKYSKRSGYWRARVVVSSDAILFLEFGSGLQGEYGERHPLEGEYNMGAGTYPSKVDMQQPPIPNWKLPYPGWEYHGDDGGKYHSTGMPASMPMYLGGREMRDNFEEIARKVFSND